MVLHVRRLLPENKTNVILLFNIMVGFLRAVLKYLRCSDIKQAYLAGWSRRGQKLLGGTDGVAVDFGRHRTLQQIHRYNDAQRPLFGAHNETFHTCQRAAINVNSLAGTEIRPGYDQGVGGDQSLEIVYLSLADRRRGVARAQNLLDARSLQYAYAVGQLKTAKQISREERLIDYFRGVAPPEFDAAQRKAGLKHAIRQLGSGPNLPSRRR